MRTESWVHVTFPTSVPYGLTYRLPADLASKSLLGHRVVVPLRHRLVVGIITEMASPPPQGGKDVLQVPDLTPVLTAEHLAFLTWISTYYMCPLGKVLRTALATVKTWYDIRLSLTATASMETFPLEAQPLGQALTQGPLSYQEATRYLPSPKLVPLLQNLVAQGAITLCKNHGLEERQFALSADYLTADGTPLATACWEAMTTQGQQTFCDTYLRLVSTLGTPWIPQSTLAAHGMSPQLMARIAAHPTWRTQYAPWQPSPPVTLPEAPPPLTPTQTQWLDAIAPSQWQGKHVAYLPLTTHHAAKVFCTAFAIQTIQQQETNALIVPNRQALRLWAQHLTPILGQRLIVASSHANTTQRQRQWHTLPHTRTALILATPSLLLYPLPKLNRLVLAQEGSQDYKQESAPRYHTRDAAIVWAQQHRAHILLTGVTPTLEAYHNLTQGKYAHLPPPPLDTSSPAPSLQCITRPRHHTLWTPSVLQRLQDTWARKHKVVILHPRRGYTAYTTCQACGWQATCSHCHTGLVHHQSTAQLHCHHCQRTFPPPHHCPTCQGTQLQYRRVGTQQIIETLILHFPTRKLARIDQDATPHDTAYQATLRAFQHGHLDGLIATQRILRALPAIDPDLIVWIDPHQWVDPKAFHPAIQQRYLCQELLAHPTATQVLVLLANAHRDTMQHLTQHRDTLYRETLAACRTHQYPPYVKFVKATLRHPQQDLLLEAAQALAHTLQTIHGLTTLGPSMALPNVKQGHAQAALWVKVNHPSHKAALQQAARNLLAQPKHRCITLTFDVDPL